VAEVKEKKKGKKKEKTSKLRVINSQERINELLIEQEKKKTEEEEKEQKKGQEKEVRGFLINKNYLDEGKRLTVEVLKKFFQGREEKAPKSRGEMIMRIKQIMVRFFFQEKNNKIQGQKER